MSNIHVIAHTHWDQEWYFTLQDSNILASRNFADVIEPRNRTLRIPVTTSTAKRLSWKISRPSILNTASG